MNSTEDRVGNSMEIDLRRVHLPYASCRKRERKRKREKEEEESEREEKMLIYETSWGSLLMKLC